MDTLRVRVYNVRFGDAILVSVPDRHGRKTVTRHVLVDVGNVLSGEGGDDVVFPPVLRNIKEVLGDQPLDLYVMTHEHLDHVQGLLSASKADSSLKLKAGYAWFTASADPDYYKGGKHPKAEKHLKEVKKVYDTVDRYLSAVPASQTPWLRTMMLNNNPQRTDDCVNHLRKLASKTKTTYVYRGCDLEGKHPFHEAKVSLWAPEEDTSVYYGRFRPMAMGMASAQETGDKIFFEAEPTFSDPKPPAGVDVGAFYNLVNLRRRGYVDNLLAIDRAANNTSVVFCLEWRGWKLLFAGDAERRSWKEMNKNEALDLVHFLKVSHHGSHTGIPDRELLDKILPAQSPDSRTRQAVVSTYPDTYKDVPDKELLETELASRCTLTYIEKGVVPDGDHLDFNFKDDGTVNITRGGT
jgi:hypothetical protein